MPSEATENYLTEILRIEESGVPATTSEMAARLGVARPSVTGMLKKLVAEKLVRREPYREAHLTPRGRVIASRILRRHRLVETFLVETLGLAPDRVHEDAHRIEHALSDEVVDRLDHLLGHPTSDPHGAAIPARDPSTTDPAASGEEDAP